ncbi:MAG: hypothetical protein JSR77_07275 [Planctomycetes bacterium]|nr:hypothetical protein [Planctomycetota bacterium]
MASAFAAEGPAAQVTRGIASAIEVPVAPGLLRAKSNQTPDSPVLVRVVPSQTPGKQRIEFIGFVAGSFDLREFLEGPGGGRAELPSLPIQVISQLPPNAGTDVFGLAQPNFSLGAHYQEILVLGAAAWALVPLVVIAKRVLRRPAPAAARTETPPPPTIAEELSTLIAAATQRPMSVSDRGRVELLLLQFLRDRHRAENADDLATQIRTLFHMAETKELVVAVERWLHSAQGSQQPDAATTAELQQFRSAYLTPKPAEGVVSP